MKDLFFVLDSRIGTTAIAEKIKDVNIINDDWIRYTAEAGTIEECCEGANSGMYGLNCIVVDSYGILQFDRFYNNKWHS